MPASSILPAILRTPRPGFVFSLDDRLLGVVFQLLDVFLQVVFGLLALFFRFVDRLFRMFTERFIVFCRILFHNYTVLTGLCRVNSDTIQSRTTAPMIEERRVPHVPVGTHPKRETSQPPRRPPVSPTIRLTSNPEPLPLENQAGDPSGRQAEEINTIRNT